ncbi:MAG: hypothetical protein ACJ762_08085 [Solirubrobacteraceae bacterium]
MAKTKNSTDLLGTLRTRLGGASKKPTGAQRVLGELRGLLPGGSTRSDAGKKAALTRKRNAAKRSAASRKGAATRAKAKRR